MSKLPPVKEVQQARWNEPVVMEMGYPGRRAQVFARPEAVVEKAVGKAADLVPMAMRRKVKPALPEMTEFEVLRHYLHLSQMVHGMMGVNLFGTCTMKYNPRLSTYLTLRPEVASIHPFQPDETLQGLLAIVHNFDLILRDLSGMDQFVFQPAGGADAAYTHACVTRGYFAAKKQLEERDHLYHPDPPLQPGHSRDGGIQRYHAAAGGKRLPVDRGAEGGVVEPHCSADGQQPG
jgi:glycine dehydrogenase subunit 2